ncbi:MAG TPA: RrF2 family transcriptional regulator [Spirochaetota bacterium]|nr:RrF2 family transcriptional regulator [Spirochaetota bacterium]
MKLSTRSRYGLRLLFQLALRYGRGPVQLSDISEREDISEKYLGQIIIHIRSSGLVGSVRGARGGYFLTRHPSQITVMDALTVLEGSLCPVECVESRQCDRADECSTRRVWSMLNDRITETLSGITLADMQEWREKESGAPSYAI